MVEYNAARVLRFQSEQRGSTYVTCPHRLACLKCDAYFPRELGQLIEARDGVVRFSMEVPLSAEEREAIDGDVEKLNEMIERRKHLPPPPVPDARYVFNQQSKSIARGKPPSR
jgi:hypothetical protein